MSFYRKQTPALFALALMALAPWQGAQAQATGSTSVSFNFPDIIILHYYNSLTLTFTGDVLDNVGQGSASDDAALGTSATFQGGLTPTGGPTIPGTVAVSVEDAWAVRGITSSGTIRLDVELTQGNATTAGGSTAAASALTIASAGVAAGDPIDVSAPGFALGNAVLGDIGFNLNITGVTESGTHSGMTYTITASAP